jgi:hypothetical protein
MCVSVKTDAWNLDISGAHSHFVVWFCFREFCWRQWIGDMGYECVEFFWVSLCTFKICVDFEFWFWIIIDGFLNQSLFVILLCLVFRYICLGFMVSWLCSFFWDLFLIMFMYTNILFWRDSQLVVKVSDKFWWSFVYYINFGFWVKIWFF